MMHEYFEFEFVVNDRKVIQFVSYTLCLFTLFNYCMIKSVQICKLLCIDTVECSNCLFLIY